jgi:hypothetical protein
MRKSDRINQISDKTGIPKVDVLVTLETMFKEVKKVYRMVKTSISEALEALSPRKEPPKLDVISRKTLL